MSQCLKDRTLVLLYSGEGTDSQRSHLQACKTCATNYQQLSRDLETIGQVLSKGPPVQMVAHPQRFAPRWLPGAVALAMIATLVWGGFWMRGPSEPVFLEEARTEDVWDFLEEVSATFLLPDDANADAAETRGDELAYLSASLVEEGPCEGDSPFFQTEGNDTALNFLEADATTWNTFGSLNLSSDDFSYDFSPFLCGGSQTFF